MFPNTDVFCPRCGSKISLYDWFSDEPGNGFGFGDCPACGEIEFRCNTNRICDYVFSGTIRYSANQKKFMPRNEYRAEPAL